MIAVGKERWKDGETEGWSGKACGEAASAGLKFSIEYFRSTEYGVLSTGDVEGNRERITAKLPTVQCRRESPE